MVGTVVVLGSQMRLQGGWLDGGEHRWQDKPTENRTDSGIVIDAMCCV